MSKVFYEKFLSLLIGLIILVCAFFGAAELLLLYSFTQNSAFYYSYCVVLALALFYGARYYMQFRSFRENLNLYVPFENEKPLEPLSMETEDRALKVCLFYRNGARLKEIEENLGLKHPTQAKRELIKGLSFLLRFYDEHRERENECQR